MSTRDDGRRRRSGRPLWLVEGLDILEQRRGPLLGAVAVVVLIPTLLAIFAPSVVPPTPLVGAAVAIAALLLGIAAALAADTTDLIVRGPRHVGAAGGELVAILPTKVNTASSRALAASVLEARDPGTQMLLGIASAGREAEDTAAWTDALAVALVKAGGVSVLRIDLASGRTDRPGLAEVVKGEIRLTSAVEIEPGLNLARIGTGDDPIRALRALAGLPGRLPADLDVLLVALPSATNREVVNATKALDHLLVMAHRDRTSRVQLIAALDAIDSTGTTPQVVLVDDPTVARIGATGFTEAQLPSTARPADAVPTGMPGADGADAEDAEDAAESGDLGEVAREDGAASSGPAPATTEPDVAEAAASGTDLGATELDDEPADDAAADEAATGQLVADASAEDAGGAGAGGAGAGGAGAGGAGAGGAGAGGASAGSEDVVEGSAADDADLDDETVGADRGAADDGESGGDVARVSGITGVGGSAVAAANLGSQLGAAGAAGAAAAAGTAAAGSAAAGSAAGASAGSETSSDDAAAEDDAPTPEWQRPWGVDEPAASSTEPAAGEDHPHDVDTAPDEDEPAAADTTTPAGDTALDGTVGEAVDEPTAEEAEEPDDAGRALEQTQLLSAVGPLGAGAPVGAGTDATDVDADDAADAAGVDADAAAGVDADDEADGAEAAAEPAAEARADDAGPAAEAVVDTGEWLRAWVSEEPVAEAGSETDAAADEPTEEGPSALAVTDAGPTAEARDAEEPSPQDDTADAPAVDVAEWERPWPSAAASIARDTGDEADTAGPSGSADASGPADDGSFDAPAPSAAELEDDEPLDLPPPDAATRFGAPAVTGEATAAVRADDERATSTDEPAGTQPRDVDVLMGVQEAAALAVTEARGADPQAPSVDDGSVVDDRAATDPQPASIAPAPADLREPAAERDTDGDDYLPPPAIRVPDQYLPLSPSAREGGVHVTGSAGGTTGGTTAGGRAGAATGSTDAAQRDAASTDELPAARRRPEPVRAVESEQEDLLRTTARLAILMDDLDVRTHADEDHPAP